MSNKLYTEEELRRYFSEIYMMPQTVEYSMDSLTPIELPSDEEIEKRYYKELEERRELAKNFRGQIAGRHPDMFGNSEIHNMVTGYLECVKWMRDKIKGGNNEQ